MPTMLPNVVNPRLMPRLRAASEAILDASLLEVGGRESLDVAFVELVIVIEHSRTIGQEAEIGFNAVGAGPECFLERPHRVLRRASRTAAMTEDQEAVHVTVIACNDRSTVVR